MRIILSRSLGAEGLGLYSVALSIFGVFTTIVASGLPVCISHRSSKYLITKDTQKEGSVVSSGLIISLVCCVVVSIVILLFKDLFIKLTNNTSYMVMIALLPGLFATAIYSCFRGALWGRKKHLENCIGEFLEQLVRLILFLVMLSSSQDIAVGAVRAGLAISISYVISMVVAIYYYFKQGGKLSSPKQEFKSLFKASAPITLIRICSSLIMSLVSVLLPMRLISSGLPEDIALALYGILVGMTMPLISFPNSLIGSYSTALIPELSTLQAQNKKEEFNEQIKLSIKITLFITFCFVPVFLGLGQAIGVFLFDSVESGVLLVKATWIMIPSALLSISSSILNVMGLETKSFINYILGFVALMICIWFLPKVVGIEALSYGMGLLFTIASVLNIVMIYKKTSVKNLIFKPLILMSIFTIPSSLICSSVFGVLTFKMPIALALCISAMLGLVFFILLCIIFDVISVYYLFKDVKKIKMFKIKNKKSIKRT